MLERLFSFLYRVMREFRAKFYLLLGQPPFKRRGHSNKIFGWDCIEVGCDVHIGDGCWIEAVQAYGVQRFRPRIILGDGVALSDRNHLSAVSMIRIDSGCLLGSNIYIGDHAHGDISDSAQSADAPGKRPLGRIADVHIGANTWLCDGVVILPGTQLAPGCVVGANSVVRLSVNRAALIAGNPARVIRFLEECVL